MLFHATRIAFLPLLTTSIDIYQYCFLLFLTTRIAILLLLTIRIAILLLLTISIAFYGWHWLLIINASQNITLQSQWSVKCMYSGGGVTGRGWVLIAMHGVLLGWSDSHL